MLKKERQVLLVIDDSEVCQRVEESLHDRFGFEVEIARDGKNALGMLEESPWQYDVTVIYDDLNERVKKLDILKKFKVKYSEIDSTRKLGFELQRDFNGFTLKNV